MKITVRSPGEKSLKFAFPTRMLFNGFTAKIGAASIKKYVSTEDADISSADLKKLMKELRRIKDRYPDLELVNVESSDGTSVIIKL